MPSSFPLRRRVFLSHAWEGDSPHATVLRLLAAIGITPGRKTPGWLVADRTFPIGEGREVQFEVFFDSRSLHHGAGLTEGIARHLGEAHILAAAWSERYPTRAACMWEYLSALFAGGAGEPPGHRVRVWPVDSDKVWGSIRPCPDVQDRLLPDLLATDPEEVWQGLAEEAARLDAPITLRAEEDHYVYGGTSADYTRFVGREGELWSLFDTLHTPGNARQANLTGAGAASRPGRQGMVQGLGGIGKTLLARVYARLFGGAYPGGIFWLEALGHNDAGAALSDQGRHAERGRQLRGVADVLSLSIPNDADETTLRALLGNALKTRGAYLWVVDDYPTRPAPGETIGQWLAPSSNGASLVTSRSRVAMGVGTDIALDVLPPDAAYALLTQEAAPVDDGEEAAARAVCESLGHHPLALAVTSAWMASSLSAAPYQALLEELETANKAELLHEYGDEAMLSQLPTGHEASILYTLRRSIGLLMEDGKLLLQAAAVLAPAPIPAALMAAILSEMGVKPDKASMEVVRAGLASMDVAPVEAGEERTRSLRIHTLVAHAAAVAQGQEARARLRGAAQGAVLEAMRGSQDARNHRALRAWAVHGRALLDESEGGLDLLGWLGRHAYEGGHYASARADDEAQWEAYARLLGEEHPVTLRSRNNLAQTLKAQGDLRGARGHEEAVFEAWVHLLGEEDPDTLTSRSNLAGTLYAQGDLKGARGHQETVWEARARLLGKEHRDTLASRSNLAGTLNAQGDLKGARGHQEAVWEAFARLLGKEHPDTLASRLNLAETLRAQGDLKGSRGHQETVWETYARLLGGEHPRTLVSRLHLASTLKAQGDLGGARGHQEAVWEASARLLGEEHPDTLTSRSNLAGTLKAQGDLKGARGHQEAIWEAWARLLGEKHTHTLTSRNNLADTLRAQGDLEGARGHQEAVLGVSARLLGEEHPDTLNSRINLAGTLYAQGDLEGARGHQEAVWEASARLLGRHHGDTTIAAWNLFCTLEQLAPRQAVHVLQEGLLWLHAADPAGLSHHQRQIRAMLAQKLQGT